MKKLRITVEGKTYEVNVEVMDAANAPVAKTVATSAPVAAPVVAAPAPVAAAAPVVAGAGSVTSPLSAVVVSVDVKVGDSITEGQKLLTLEAMKMNTFVFAPSAGKVASIAVSAGQSVAEGEVLINLA